MNAEVIPEGTASRNLPNEVADHGDTNNRRRSCWYSVAPGRSGRPERPPRSGFTLCSGRTLWTLRAFRSWLAVQAGQTGRALFSLRASRASVALGTLFSLRALLTGFSLWTWRKFDRVDL